MSNGLTIGIPVYNEEARIERAIRSAAPQCESLIVADNASTDNTGTICARLAQEFPNMKYFRHAENMGARKNCEFILHQAETPYLMFLGGHDYIDDDYANAVLPAISSDDSVAVAIGGVRFEYDDRSEDARSFNDWTGGLQHNAYDRVRSFLFDRATLAWSTYGIFRTSTFRSHYTADLPTHGVDVIFMARILAQGRLKVVGNTRYHAWIRNRDDHKSDYLERITANRPTARTGKYLRNEFRVAEFQALMNFFPSAGLARKVALRYQAMVRFGTFRLPGRDALYYLLYLPVKLARKFSRASRLILKGS